MAPVNQEHRASELAERSIELINSGKVEVCKAILLTAHVAHPIYLHFLSVIVRFLGSLLTPIRKPPER